MEAIKLLQQIIKPSKDTVKIINKKHRGGGNG